MMPFLISREEETWLIAIFGLTCFRRHGRRLAIHVLLEKSVIWFYSGLTFGSMSVFSILGKGQSSFSSTKSTFYLRSYVTDYAKCWWQKMLPSSQFSLPTFNPSIKAMCQQGPKANRAQCNFEKAWLTISCLHSSTCESWILPIYCCTHFYLYFSWRKVEKQTAAAVRLALKVRSLKSVYIHLPPTELVVQNWLFHQEK